MEITITKEQAEGFLKDWLQMELVKQVKKQVSYEDRQEWAKDLSNVDKWLSLVGPGPYNVSEPKLGAASITLTDDERKMILMMAFATKSRPRKKKTPAEKMADIEKRLNRLSGNS